MHLMTNELATSFLLAYSYFQPDGILKHCRHLSERLGLLSANALNTEVPQRTVILECFITVSSNSYKSDPFSWFSVYLFYSFLYSFCPGRGQPFAIRTFRVIVSTCGWE